MPLMGSLQTLDLGDNPGLAWVEPLQNVFASSAVGAWGWRRLYNL